MSTTKRPYARLKRAAPKSEGVDISQWIMTSAADPDNDEDNEGSQEGEVAEWVDVLAMAGRMRTGERLAFIREELLPAGVW